jgi:hypothetical protein
MIHYVFGKNINNIFKYYIVINNYMESRDATKSSNGFFYQRIYLCYIILDKLKNNNDNLKAINFIEEYNINSNEYEDFTFIQNNKITSYQIKYKNKNDDNKYTSESITKDCGFIKSFVPYFDKKYNGINIDTIFYVVSKKENNESNYLNIFKYDPETIYKYMILLACDKTINGNYTEENIINNYEKIETNYINLINYDNNLLNTKKNDDKKNKVFESFKKIMKEETKDKIIEHIKKYTIQDGETYCNLIKQMNTLIKELANGNEKQEYKSINKQIIIEYIRFKIIDELTKNSFCKHNLMTLQSIHNIIKKFFENEKTMNDNKIFNDLFLQYFTKLEIYNEKQDITADILSLFDTQNNNLSYLNNIHLDTDILNKIHKMYKDTKSDEIKKLYDKIKEIFCVQMCYKLDTKKSEGWKSVDYIQFVKSCYNYLHHNVDKKIETKKSESKIIKKFTTKKIKKKILKNN